MLCLKIILDKKSKKLIKNIDNFTKKKVFKRTKLFIQAGGAKPAPPVSSILGQFGINLPEFCDRFNAKTKQLHPELLLSVLVVIFNNKTFSFSVKPVLVSDLVFSFKVEESLLDCLSDLNDTKKINNLVINFYKMYLTFLFTRERPVLYLTEGKECYSFNALNYLRQVFGYINSFSRFKNSFHLIRS